METGTISNSKKRRRTGDVVGDIQPQVKHPRRQMDSSNPLVILDVTPHMVEFLPKPKQSSADKLGGSALHKQSNNVGKKNSRTNTVGISKPIEALTSEDDSISSLERDSASPTPTGKVAKQNKGKQRVEEPVDPADVVRLLSTKWLTTKQLKKLEEERGLDYRRGAFTATERAAIDTALNSFAVEHRLSRAEAIEIIFTKRGLIKQEHKTFWSDLAVAVPLRPLVAVFNFCKRAYHPLQKQGKWTPDEDDALLAAVKEYGQFWEKVSQRVGRMAGDCQDRYRNNLQHTSDRKIGLWTKKEEDQLITIMKELESKSAATKSDILWEEVSKRMGGTRTNLQLRQKWDELKKHIKVDGQIRWSSADSYILIHKISDLDVNDESEIEWKLLPDETWPFWTAHKLQVRWSSMKRKVDGYETMPFTELVSVLLKKNGSMSPQELADAMEQANRPIVKDLAVGSSSSRARDIKSKEFIEDSDVEEESD